MLEFNFEGETYTCVPEQNVNSCFGCALNDDYSACTAAQKINGCLGKIWIMKEATEKLSAPTYTTKQIADALSEWAESIDAYEFVLFLEKHADPEYAEYKRLAEKFKRI